MLDFLDECVPVQTGLVLSLSNGDVVSGSYAGHNKEFIMLEDQYEQTLQHIGISDIEKAVKSL